MQQVNPTEPSSARIHGVGEMTTLVRALDWTTTSLGPIENWSSELVSAVNLMLSSPLPTALYWGSELIFLYNDAYRPFASDKHPSCLGHPARVVWDEAWHLVGADLEEDLATGRTRSLENIPIAVLRDGRLQECFWTYSVSPVFQEGRIGGVFNVSQETTDAVRASRERDAAAQQMQQVLDATTDGVIGVDRNWRIAYVNKSAQEITSPAGSVVGMDLWKAFPGASYDGSPYLEHYRRAMDERVPGRFEAYYPAPFDAWFTVVVRPYEDGIVIFFRNVTQKRREAEALRESQGRLNAVYNTALEYIGILSPNGNLLDCNRASLGFAGSNREELVGKPFWDGPWFALTPGASDYCRQAVQNAASGSPVRTELALTRPNGETIIFDFSITPVRDQDGQVVFLVPEGRDITSLKSAEESLRRSSEALAASQEELRFTVDLSTQIPFTADAQGNITTFSDNWFELTGLTRDETPGDGWTRVQHPDDVPLMIERRNHAIRTGEPFDVEHRVHIASGEYRWMRSRAFPRRDASGHIVKWYGTLEDIHERKRAEEALIQSEKLAAVGRLASSIAHEINNPLEAVTNLLYLAQISNISPEVQDYLDSADRELRRIAAITNQTLRFHKQTSNPRSVACEELIDSVIAMYQGRLLNSRVRIERRKRSVRPVICFDGEVRQVLLNLVGNAVDAMHPKGGRLLLRGREARNWKSSAKGIVITVADTGGGMSRKTLEKLFQPFFTTKGFSGNGLGLWVSQEIVRRHHGSLRVRSSQRPGRTGTVFTLYLPYEPAPRETPR